MSATDELRRLLDERGVEYTTDDGKYLKETCWAYLGELMAAFVEFDNGETRFELDHWCFTPEQAIAATLGDDATAFAKRIEQAVESRKPLTLFGIDYEVRGECEFKPFPGEDWVEPNAVLGVCSACSALMHGGDSYCANCGKAVKR